MTDLRDEVRDGDIYVYKLTCDNGGAPCIHDGLLSLSICKPRIRTSARAGDWVIGFGGKSVRELRDKVIYVAKISAVEPNGKYYMDGAYSNRPDCIYEAINSGYRYREGKQYHSAEDLTHDLGQAPGFDRAVSLLSNQFVYFGGADNRPSIDAVRDIYDGLPRDYRKNHPDDIRRRLEEFIVAVFAFKPDRNAAVPTHRDTRMKCHGVEDEEVTVVRCSR